MSGATPGAPQGDKHSPKLLNVGCGGRFHQDWINIDVAPQSPAVHRHDVRRPLPFPPASLDAVYHSHVLEHLTPAEAARFLRDCHRVLRAGGVLRVVVPDLEEIARRYLEWLGAARAGDPEAAERREWMVIELLDQGVRHVSGGRVPEFLRTCTRAGREFAIGRLGAEAELLLNAPAEPNARPRLARLVRYARTTVARTMGANWRVGRFRLGGEVHQQMYDAFSLSRALESAGFVAIRIVAPTASRIPGWPNFCLDARSDGTPHKPDSLYVEAAKAGADHS